MLRLAENSRFAGRGTSTNVNLLEPIKMEETLRTSPPVVRFENGSVLLLAGIAQRYACETSADPAKVRVGGTETATAIKQQVRATAPAA